MKAADKIRLGKAIESAVAAVLFSGGPEYAFLTFLGECKSFIVSERRIATGKHFIDSNTAARADDALEARMRWRRVDGARDQAWRKGNHEPVVPLEQRRADADHAYEAELRRQFRLYFKPRLNR